MMLVNPGAVTIPTSSKPPKFQAPVSGVAPDPLAGITFTLRLQTHSGFGATPLAPLGLYQDAAKTIPATQDFDPVAAWEGVLMGVPVTAVQADEDKQPYLLFVDGVPTVVFDGVDDRMTVALAVGNDFFAAVGCSMEISTAQGSAYAPFFLTADNEARLCWRLDATAWGAYGTGAISSGESLAAGAYNLQVDAVDAGATAIVTLYRSNVEKGASGMYNDGGTSPLTLGAEPGFNRYLNGALVFVLFTPDHAARATISTYTDSLLP